MSCYTAIFLQLILVLTLHQHQLATATIPCVIEGLPPDVVSEGNVHVLKRTGPTVTLSLTCKCQVKTPLWEIRQLESETVTITQNNVKCVNNSKVCTSTYISEPNQSHGLYTYISKDFNISTGTTVMQCRSTNERAVLTILVEEEEDHTSSILPLPTSSYTTSTSRTPVITTTTITTTYVVSRTCTSDSTTPTVHLLQTNPTDKQGIVDAMGGPSTLSLISIIAVLLVVSITFCAVLLYVGVKYHKKIRIIREHNNEMKGYPATSSLKGPPLDTSLMIQQQMNNG